MLPDVDGVEVLRSLHSQGRTLSPGVRPDRVSTVSSRAGTALPRLRTGLAPRRGWIGQRVEDQLAPSDGSVHRQARVPYRDRTGIEPQRLLDRAANAYSQNCSKLD